MSIEVKFSELEKIKEEDKEKIFKLIFDQAASNPEGDDLEVVDFDREPGDDIEELVEKAREHYKKITKSKTD